VSGRPRPGRARLLALALTAVACGCHPGATTYVDLSQTPRQYVPADYRRVYERWTRDALITKDYDTSLDVFATMKSYDFRWAYAVRYSAVYQLTTAEQEALLKTQLTELGASLDFHLSAAATRFEWIDFAKPTSIWRITLLDEQGREVKPLEVKKLKLPMPELDAFYPPSTRTEPVQAFYTPYLIRFPYKLPDGSPLVTPATRKLTLRITGVLGAAELTWALRPPENK
jgi:hypothetical protein